MDIDAAGQKQKLQGRQNRIWALYRGLVRRGSARFSVTKLLLILASLLRLVSWLIGRWWEGNIGRSAKLLRASQRDGCVR